MLRYIITTAVYKITNIILCPILYLPSLFVDMTSWNVIGDNNMYYIGIIFSTRSWTETSMVMEILFEKRNRNTIYRVTTQNLFFIFMFFNKKITHITHTHTHKHTFLPIVFYTVCSPVGYNIAHNTVLHRKYPEGKKKQVNNFFMHLLSYRTLRFRHCISQITRVSRIFYTQG